MLRKGRFQAQIQHQIEILAGRLGSTPEINRAGNLAHIHTGTMRLASLHIDLVIQTNGTFGARNHTGVATSAQVQIDRVVTQPAELECAQPARE